jgi:hypothetical protein
MRDALALELHQEIKLTTGEKVKKLRLVARALVDNAIEGDTAAVRECFDRMDGKVTQSVDTTGQVRGNITFTWESDGGDISSTRSRHVAKAFKVLSTSRVPVIN